MLSTALVSPAHAEPITAAIFGSAFAATGFGTVVSSFIGAGVSWLAGTAINWLFPTKQESVGSSDSTSSTTKNAVTMQFGERVSMGGVFGTCPVDPHFVTMNEYNSATILQQVHILADIKISGLAAVKVDGKLHNLTTVSNSGNNEHYTYTVDDFNGKIVIRLHDGRSGQAADTNLVAQTSGWDSTKKFSGKAYTVTEITSDSALFSGIPEIIPIPIGAVCYDIRKDSTVAGGSGSHRFNDQSTWQYTENPFVQGYHFCRGFFFNGVKVLGVGYSAAKLDTDTWVAAMNVADETVTDPNDVDHPRYTCHTAFQDSDEYGSVLDTLCQSAGGYWAERNGKIAVFAGKVQSSVLTITDGDLVVDEDLTFDQKRAGEALYMGVQGTYTSATDFAPAPYEALSDTGFTPSNTEPKILNLNLPQIKDPWQSFRVAKQTLFAINTQASAQIVLDIKNVLVEVGDWIHWPSDMSVVGDRYYKVMSTNYDMQSMRMSLGLQETSADVFDDNATSDDIVEPPRSVPVGTYLQQVQSFDVDVVTLTGADGGSFPALKFTYTPIADPGVLAIDIEYYAKAIGVFGDPDYLPQGPTIKITDPTPSDGIVYQTVGVSGARTYTARAFPSSIAGRDVDWTGWVDTPTVTPDWTVNATFTGPVTYEILDDALKNAYTIVQGDSAGSMLDSLDVIRANEAALAAQNLLDQANNKTRTDLLIVGDRNKGAAVITERTARVDGDTALAQQITEVIANVGNLIADGKLSMTAEIDPDNITATIIAQVKAVDPDNNALSQAGWMLRAAVTSGGEQAYFGVYGNFYVFTFDGDGNLTPFPALSVEMSAVTGEPEVILKAARAEIIYSPDHLSYIDLTNGIEIYSQS